MDKTFCFPENFQSAAKSQAPAPQRIILPTSDLVEQFEAAVGPEIHQRDITAILGVVIQSVLFEEDNSDLERMVHLPDFHRMHSAVFFKDPSKIETVKRAAWNLSAAIYERLKSFGAYRRGEFPYIFDCLLGKDIVLQFLVY